jgi:energy-coupling factor transporter transmembrane protein EcfT
MAELTVFRFRPGQSLLHRLDVRFKLLFLVLLSLASLRSGAAGALLLILAFTGLIFYLRISFFSLCRTVRYFLLLLAVIFAVRAFSAPGAQVWGAGGITISREGLFEGAGICLRLWLLVLMGLTFIATSRPSEVRSAVAWILKPVPLVPESRVATMLSLIIRFIPLIFDQAAKTGEAQRARGIENRKNPAYRLKRFTIPFMRRIFEDADRLVIAMEARCYREDRTGHSFAARPADWAAAAVVGGACLLLVLL